MLITIITLLLAAVMFAWGRVRSDVVALIALMVLVCTGILDVHEALSGFSNPIVVMMAGLFVVVVLATGLIGGFVSNTGTVAYYAT